MKGGTAAGWNQTFVNNALNATPQTFGMWAAFKNKVLAAFSPIDVEGKAAPTSNISNRDQDLLTIILPSSKSSQANAGSPTINPSSNTSWTDST
jgi:hypothetical protein